MHRRLFTSAERERQAYGQGVLFGVLAGVIFGAPGWLLLYVIAN